jgi:hypothetical protein
VNLLELVRRVRDFFRPPQAPRLEINGFERLTPLHSRGGSTVLNRAGRLVLRGDLRGRPVKIYEAANPAHAAFVSAVTSSTGLAEIFPRVIALQGSFVVADWVPDNETKSVTLDEISGLQRRVHGTPVHDFPGATFDYWHDYVWPRFVRAADVLELRELAKKIFGLVTSAWKAGPPVLMHPDLKPSNFVRLQDGRLQIVDNELLSVGGLPLLDVCNTAYALGPKRGQEYANLYFATLKAAPLDVEALEAAWLSRRIGSAFVAGDLAQADALSKIYQRVGQALPFEVPR